MDREHEVSCALAKTLGVLESILESPITDAEVIREVLKRRVEAIYEVMPYLKKPVPQPPVTE